MKKRNIVYYLLLILIMAVLTGCGYTQEEKAEMKRYEKQGRENAENYIKAKYGIDAKVRELNCEKYNSGPVPDFFPSPTGNVFIRMNYQGKDFSVFISGENAAVITQKIRQCGDLVIQQYKLFPDPFVRVIICVYNHFS